MFLVLFTLLCITAIQSSPICPDTPEPFTQRRYSTFSNKGEGSKGWCDRILYLTQGQGKIAVKSSDYSAISNSKINESDHDLVMAYYTIEKSVNVLSVTFNIGDKKPNDDPVEERFNAIMCSLKAKVGKKKWNKIDIFHFAFQEANAWWNTLKKRPRFDFGITLGKQEIIGSDKWVGIAKHCGGQGVILYVYYNKKKIKYYADKGDNRKSWRYFYDANDGLRSKKSFKMVGYFKRKTRKKQKKPYLIVFGTAHLPRKGDKERIDALNEIKKRFTKYNKNVQGQNVILILGADTNFRADIIHGKSGKKLPVPIKDSLARYLKVKKELKHWKEIAVPRFQPTCKRIESKYIYKGRPKCEKANSLTKCWSECEEDDKVCKKEYSRRAHESTTTSKGKTKKGCKNNLFRFLCSEGPTCNKADADAECWSECQTLPYNTNNAKLYAVCTEKYVRRGKWQKNKLVKQKCEGEGEGVQVRCRPKIPTCAKDKNAVECLSTVTCEERRKCRKEGKNICRKEQRKYTGKKYKWKKSGKMYGYRFLCGNQVDSDITPWNHNNYIYNQPTSNSYYMYFITIAVLLMIVILCTIFGLCAGSICFVGAYYYGQQSKLNKVHQMDEKYPSL